MRPAGAAGLMGVAGTDLRGYGAAEGTPRTVGASAQAPPIAVPAGTRASATMGNGCSSGFCTISSADVA